MCAQQHCSALPALHAVHTWCCGSSSSEDRSMVAVADWEEPWVPGCPSGPGPSLDCPSSMAPLAWLCAQNMPAYHPVSCHQHQRDVTRLAHATTYLMPALSAQTRLRWPGAAQGLGFRV